MLENFNKYFLNILKVLSFLSFLLYIYFSYSILYLAKSEVLTIIYIVLLYIFGYFSLVALISSFRKLERVYFLSISLSPLIPTLLYTIYLIINPYLDGNNSVPIVNFYSNYIIIISSIKILLLYVVLILFTKVYTDLLSDIFIKFILGKEFDEYSIMGHDFPYISIYSKMDGYYTDFKFDLITDIIKNLLGYKLKDHSIVTYKEKKHDIFRFSRTHYYNFKRYKDNILLIPMNLFDASYLNWLDDSIGYENSPNLELDYLENAENTYSWENDFEILENVTYHCYFLKQYYETEDKIEHINSNGNETYLAFANILSTRDKFIHYNTNYQPVFNNEYADDTKVRPHLYLNKSLIINYRKDEILSSNIWDVRNILFSQYILYNYGTLIDKLDTLLNNKLKTKHLKIMGIFSIILILIISLKLLGVINVLGVLATIATIIYTIVFLYDRFKGAEPISQILETREEDKRCNGKNQENEEISKKLERFYIPLSQHLENYSRLNTASINDFNTLLKETRSYLNLSISQDVKDTLMELKNCQLNNNYKSHEDLNNIDSLRDQLLVLVNRDIKELENRLKNN